MTNLEAFKLGQKARPKATAMHPDLASWEIFKRTLGFFQWKRKNALTDENVEAFGQGYMGHTPDPAWGSCPEPL